MNLYDIVKITTAKLADASITLAKLGQNISGTGPAFRAYPSASINAPSGVFTKLQNNIENFDSNNSYNNSTFRFQPSVSGYYQINAGVTCAAGATLMLVSLHKNGIEHSRGQYVDGITYDAVVSDIIFLNGTTDYVEAAVFQGSGLTIVINSGSVGTFFSGALLRNQ